MNLLRRLLGIFRTEMPKEESDNPISSSVSSKAALPLADSIPTLNIPLDRNPGKDIKLSMTALERPEPILQGPEISPTFDILLAELNDEQARMYQILEHSDHHILVTCVAGTGKSHLLRYFVRSTSKRAIVVAFTGVAALNAGGQTIHSLFKLPFGFVDPDSIRVSRDTREILKNIDTVVIDEISMVRADHISGIDVVLRISRENDSPFGGAQIISFGDLFQLPPVVDDLELLKYFSDNWGGYFFFNSPVWKGTALDIYSLTTIFRQSEPKFISILNAIRDGSFSTDQLSELNRQVTFHSNIPEDGVVTLAGTRKVVADINDRRLHRLPGAMRVYEAIVEGDLPEGSYPTERQLTLKVGAQIMFVKNDRYGRWVNGTLGIVGGLLEEEVVVEVDGIKYWLGSVSWEKIKYVYYRDSRKVGWDVVGTFTQLPIRLAWALTIHKSQGSTFRSVAVDLRDGAFDHGQTYVALSRCTSMSGLYLFGDIRRKDIIIDPAVAFFMKNASITAA